MKNNTLAQLNKLNSFTKIKSIFDSSFDKYGSILDSEQFQSAINYLNNNTVMPLDGNNYVADDATLLKTIDSNVINDFYQSEIQFGFVNGNNDTINALEWHDCPEVNVFATNAILMLGLVSDIKNNQYNIDQLEAFFIPENTCLVIFSSTLHFSPIRTVSTGFKCGVLLSKGTNIEFIKDIDDRLIFKTNKRIIIHDEFTRFKELGAHVGLIGTNHKINIKR